MHIHFLDKIFLQLYECIETGVDESYIYGTVEGHGPVSVEEWDIWSWW